MKKFLFLGLILCFQSIFSQVTLAGNRLEKDGQSYKFSKYKQVFSNPVARDYFKKARTNKTIGEVLAYSGGFSIGLGIGDIIAQGKERTVSTIGGQSYVVKPHTKTGWLLIGAGVGLIGIAIPFSMAVKKNADKAMETENSGNTVFQPYFKLNSTGNGLALSYHF